MESILSLVHLFPRTAAWWLGLAMWVLGMQACAWADTVDTAVIHLPTGVARADITGSVSYWIDTTGLLNVRDVAQAEAESRLKLSPAEPTVSHRLGHGVLWQKLVIEPLPPGQRWYLQFGFHGVDWVSLFSQDNFGQWQGKHAGDHVAVAEWPLRERIPVFELQNDRPVQRTYWLRTASYPVPVAAQLYILRDDALNLWRQESYLLLGGYFGLAILVVYLGALNARQFQDRTFAFYAVYVGAMLMIQMSSLGIGGMALWPNSAWWNDAAPYLFSMISCTGGTLLVREVCGVRRFSHRTDNFVLGWALFGVAWGVFYISLPSAKHFVVLAAYQSLTLVLVIGLCLWSYRQGERWGRWMALSFAPVVLTAPFPSLRNYGLLPANFFTHYALAVGAAMEVPILLWVLSRRARDMREAQVRSQAMDTRDPLTGLTPVDLLLFRFRDALVRARRNRKPCAVLAVNLTNYTEIQAEHGRETAERALVVTASRLAQIARDVDTVSRTGIHRFAILVESPVAALDLNLTATRIVARGLNESVKLPRGVTLKLHVAGLMAPEVETTLPPEAKDCLKRVDDALDQMTSDSRKAILHLNY